jgi:predicted metal-dependent hydrolase
MPAPIIIDEIIRSTRKTIAIVIQADGRLIVRAPVKMPGHHIQEFVNNHTNWILKKKAQALAAPRLIKKNFTNGERFLFVGKEYPLTVVTNQHAALTFSGDRFHLAKNHLPKAREAFIRWYKTQARDVISNQVDRQASRLALSFKYIRISSARTRWGSCSATGTLSFTWRLVLAPMEIIDYVVIHELIHLKIRNHSPKFWRRVAEVMPEYKRCVSWLRKNGRLLSLDGN